MRNSGFLSAKCGALTTLVAAVLLAPAPGRADPQADALAALDRRNILFDIYEFVDLVKRGDDENLAIFLKAGQTPNEPACVDLLQGWTPLHHAILKGFTKASEVLITGGADPNARGPNRWTPLQLASMFGQKTVVESLLRAGAEVDARNVFGVSALQLAVQERYVDITDVLLAHGANAAFAAKSGASPLSIAIDSDREKILEVLGKHGYGDKIAMLRKRYAEEEKAHRRAVRERERERRREFQEKMRATGVGTQK